MMSGLIKPTFGSPLRVVHFGTANEHSDWETAHDVFSLAYGYHRDRRPTPRLCCYARGRDGGIQAVLGAAVGVSRNGAPCV